MIVDAQLHEFGPRGNWDGVDTATRQGVTTEIILAWMDAIGVDATLVHPRDDAWAQKALAQHPDRFAGVFSIRDPASPDLEDEVERLCAIRGVVAFRLSFGRMPNDPTGEAGDAKFKAGVFDRLFAACAARAIPLFCSAYGYTANIGAIAKRYPKLTVIADHMGMAQPPLNPRDNPPWKQLAPLLELSDLPNLAVKMSGVPVYSARPFPFDDVWPYVGSILERFGPERVMWASDIGRFQGRIGWTNEFEVAHGDYPGKHTYGESLFWLRGTDRLSPREKALLLGGTVRRLIGWPTTGA